MCRLAVKLMQSGVILGVTGSFSGVDSSGRFKQPTLFASTGARGSGGGRGAGGGGPQLPARKKQKVFDEATGAWNGCFWCGAKAKVSVAQPSHKIKSGKEGFWARVGYRL